MNNLQMFEALNYNQNINFKINYNIILILLTSVILIYLVITEYNPAKKKSTCKTCTKTNNNNDINKLILKYETENFDSVLNKNGGETFVH